MGTIGTESAFEVSARARALEAQGRSIVHLQIGEPDFDTPANVREAAKRALDAGATHYPPFAGHPGPARGDRRGRLRAQGLRGRPVAGLRHGRRQGRDAVRDPRPGRSGRRGPRPGPGLPDLRVADPLRRRDAGPDPDPDGERLPARRRRAGLADHAADARADHQLAGQPDRRRAHPRRPRADRRARHRARPVGPRRRDLRPDPVRRRRARLDRIAARDGRADDRPRRLLEDVRHDRLAAGLRDRAPSRWSRPTASSSSTRSAASRRSPRSARSRR